MGSTMLLPMTGLCLQNYQTEEKCQEVYDMCEQPLDFDPYCGTISLEN